MNDKPKISLIIPYMESDPGKQAVLERCVSSIKGYDELILVWNWKMGYAKPINKGFALAKGDFLVMATDDLIFNTGENDLRDLIDPQAVTSPIINKRSQDFWGACFCLPRWVYEKVGPMWEGYRISYFDDDDYKGKLEKHQVMMRSEPKVTVTHPDGGRTLHTFPDWQDFFEENKKIFEERKAAGFPD